MKRRYVQAWAGGFASIGVSAIGNLPEFAYPMPPSGWLAISALLHLVSAPVLLGLQHPRVNRLDLAFGLLMLVHSSRLVAFSLVFIIDHTTLSLSRALLYVAIMAAHIAVAREPEIHLIDEPNGT